MDLVDYKESSYDQVVEEVNDLLNQVRFATDDTTFVPISAFEGDNISEESENTPWYDGPTLLESLNDLPESEPPTDAPLRLPIQDVYTISGIGTVPVGRVETGILNIGDNVSFQPSDVGGEVKTVEMHHEEVPKAEPGDNVGFNVRGLGRTTSVAVTSVVPPTTRRASPRRSRAGRRRQHHPASSPPATRRSSTPTRRRSPVRSRRSTRRSTPRRGEVAEENPDFIKSGDAAVVTVRPQKAAQHRAVRRDSELGSFAIRDMGQTIAAGKVLEVNER